MTLEDPVSAAKEQAMARLLQLADLAERLPRGTRSTNEAKFYELAREWAPFLVRHYLKTIGKHTT